MTDLDSLFADTTRLGIDTAPIIYFVEAHPVFDTLVTDIFQRIANGAFEGITSVISLIEVLVHPMRYGNFALQRRYQTLLTSNAHFKTLNINASSAILAAELRARYPIRTPDALQIAVALSSKRIKHHRIR